jgi:hypothetical protein
MSSAFWSGFWRGIGALFWPPPSPYKHVEMGGLREDCEPLRSD